MLFKMQSLYFKPHSFRAGKTISACSVSVTSPPRPSLYQADKTSNCSLKTTGTGDKTPHENMKSVLIWNCAGSSEILFSQAVTQ